MANKSIEDDTVKRIEASTLSTATNIFLGARRGDVYWSKNEMELEFFDVISPDRYVLLVKRTKHPFVYNETGECLDDEDGDLDVYRTLTEEHWLYDLNIEYADDGHHRKIRNIVNFCDVPGHFQIQILESQKNAVIRELKKENEILKKYNSKLYNIINTRNNNMGKQSQKTTHDSRCCGNCEAFDFEDTTGFGVCLEGDVETHCSNCCSCHILKQQKNGK